MKNKKYSMPNHLANSLDNSSQNAQYDKHAKEILANKQVLSRILSATVAEYKGNLTHRTILLLEQFFILAE